MVEKRAAATPPAIPLEVNVPSGVLGVLDDLSSMILGELATRRKLQAILETLSEHIDVERARFVLDCRLGRDSRALPAGPGDPRLAALLGDYPALRDSLTRGRATVVESGGPPAAAAGDDANDASICVPICRGGGIVGLLCVSVPRARGGLSPWEVDFCSILANMAGAALTTA